MKTLRRSLFVLLLAVGPAACSNSIMGPSHNPDGGLFQDGAVFHNPDGGDHNPDGGDHNPDGGLFGG